MEKNKTVNHPLIDAFLRFLDGKGEGLLSSILNCSSAKYQRLSQSSFSHNRNIAAY